jgi:hypothetical protein
MQDKTGQGVMRPGLSTLDFTHSPPAAFIGGEYNQEHFPLSRIKPESVFHIENLWIQQS